MTIETILSFWLVFVVLIAVAELLEQRETRLTSARRRWPANLGLTAMLAGLGALIPVGGIVGAAVAREGGYGLLPNVGIGGWAAVAITLLVASFWDWLCHFAAHKLPVLWRFHQIHHSDRDLDVTSTFRAHPLLAVALAVATAGMALGLGLVPEALVAHAAVVLVIDLSHHTSLQLPERWDRALRPYLITPAMHHIHHSDDIRETDTNFGHDIALWDRLFGTYRAEPVRGPEAFRYGLEQFPRKRADALGKLLVAPFGPLRPDAPSVEAADVDPVGLEPRA